MAKDFRTRNWRFLVYPESAVQNWLSVLENEWNVSGFVSPLHEPDPEEGVLKPHYHVILTFEGNKSADQVKEIADSIGAVMYSGKLAYKAKVQQLRGAVRYLVHYDCAPEDHKQSWQDAPDQVRGLCGQDPRCYFEMSQDEIDIALEEMRRAVRKYQITEFSTFVDWCDRHNKTYAHLVNTRFSNLMALYIKSRRHNVAGRDVDPETGEYCD